MSEAMGNLPLEEAQHNEKVTCLYESGRLLGIEQKTDILRREENGFGISPGSFSIGLDLIRKYYKLPDGEPLEIIELQEIGSGKFNVAIKVTCLVDGEERNFVLKISHRHEYSTEQGHLYNQYRLAQLLCGQEETGIYSVAMSKGENAGNNSVAILMDYVPIPLFDRKKGLDNRDVIIADEEYAETMLMLDLAGIQPDSSIFQGRLTKEGTARIVDYGGIYQQSLPEIFVTIQAAFENYGIDGKVPPLENPEKFAQNIYGPNAPGLNNSNQILEGLMSEVIRILDTITDAQVPQNDRDKMLDDVFRIFMVPIGEDLANMASVFEWRSAFPESVDFFGLLDPEKIKRAKRNLPSDPNDFLMFIEPLIVYLRNNPTESVGSIRKRALMKLAARFKNLESLRFEVP